jgi:2,3-bisphosphoglycerate-dependent phosphoglycerate mutase
MLRNSNIQFDEVHTSLLRRSIRTTNVVLMELGQEYIPVYKSWRLNERNYGNLVGKNKKQCVAECGASQVKRWRRSFDEPPPPMSDDHPYHPANDPRYRNMLHKIPKSESLKCTMQRTSVYWDNVLAPAIQEGKTVLVVGHENNLRSLIMRLEGISADDIINLSLPRAVPLAYRLDGNLRPINPRADGSLDEATGFLTGEWLGGDGAVSEILQRDEKQVYDTTVVENLEIGASDAKKNKYMDICVSDPSPEAKAKGDEAAGSFMGSVPVNTSMREPCGVNGSPQRAAA